MGSKKPPPGDTKVAIAYIRVSTEEQNLGPKAQRRDIERWAKTNGVRVAGWHTDHGLSGGLDPDKRPGLMDALEDLGKHKAGWLLVANRSRLARDVVIAAGIERLTARAGARIASADGVGAGEGPEAQLMTTLVDAFAQYERALIRSRTKKALAEKKARGERMGELAYGQRADRKGRVTQHAAELAAIARVRQLRAQGQSLRGVVARMNQEGHRARGERWHLTTVVRLLSQSP